MADTRGLARSAGQVLSTPLGDRDIYRLDSLAELVATLQPEIVGHLDLIRKFDGMETRIDPGVFANIERVLEAVSAAGTRLDINCGALRRGLSPVCPLPDLLSPARAAPVPGPRRRRCSARRSGR